MIKEGIEGGSIKTDFPKECAELLLLLCNIWLNPILFNRTFEDTISRFKFIQFTMKQLGVDVIDNKLLDTIKNNLKGVGINVILYINHKLVSLNSKFLAVLKKLCVTGYN